MKIYKTIALYGERVEKLGRALQEPDTTLIELQDIAHSCGMRVHIFVMPQGNDDQETVNEEEEKYPEKQSEDTDQEDTGKISETNKQSSDGEAGGQNKETYSGE